MHVVAFSGGSNADEASARFARLALDELEKCGHTTEMIMVGATPPAHCTGCNACLAAGVCVQNDAVNEWKNKLEQADAFLITGSIRNSGLCSTMVALLERFQQMGRADPDFLRGKFGSLGVTGSRDGGMKAVFDVVGFFQNSNATLVWPCYWPFTWSLTDDTHFENNDPEGFDLALDVAHQIAGVLK